MKQLEREVDRHKHGANQLMQRNEQLVKEVEGHRQNLHHTGIQMENMKRELGDALVSIFKMACYYLFTFNISFMKACFKTPG